MTPIHADDLPPEMRRKLGLTGGGSKRRNTGKGSNDSDPCTGSCGACGERFDTYLRWEKHAKTSGHARWLVDLE